jgi:hypothetical protein
MKVTSVTGEKRKISFYKVAATVGLYVSKSKLSRGRSKAFSLEQY